MAAFTEDTLHAVQNVFQPLISGNLHLYIVSLFFRVFPMIYSQYSDIEALGIEFLEEWCPVVYDYKSQERGPVAYGHHVLGDEGKRE